MTKLSAIIVDDERSALQALQYELDTYCPEVRLEASFKDPHEALQWITAKDVDVVFLDIEMPVMNGFDLLEKLPELPFDVIFVTAYDQFAIRAFDFNAVDYLLKPVRKSKLIEAVQKVVHRQRQRMDKNGLEALIQNIRVQAHTGLEQIALPTSEGFTMVHINDITYLQADSNYTWVVTGSGKKYLVAKTLKEMESMLQFPQYFRAHKSYLVNLNHVDRYIRGQGGYLVMRDNHQVAVARAQRSELMRMLHL
jgi:two-component system LytT family response regulator